MALSGRYSFVHVFTNDDIKTYRLHAKKGQDNDSYILKGALSAFCNADNIILMEKYEFRVGNSGVKK